MNLRCGCVGKKIRKVEDVLTHVKNETAKFYREMAIPSAKSNSARADSSENDRVHRERKFASF